MVIDSSSSFLVNDIRRSLWNKRKSEWILFLPSLRDTEDLEPKHIPVVIHLDEGFAVLCANHISIAVTKRDIQKIAFSIPPDMYGICLHSYHS